MALFLETDAIQKEKAEISALENKKQELLSTINELELKQEGKVTKLLHLVIKVQKQIKLLQLATKTDLNGC